MINKYKIEGEFIYLKEAEKSEELKDAASEKMREACIKMKKKMGGDVSECDTQD